jgi:TatD DNase family protein
MTYSLIDTHCHLDFELYDADRTEVIERALAAGVVRILNPAIDAVTGAGILELADAHPAIFAAVGIHPNSTANFQPSDLAPIEAQADHRRTVAIGEIGLDYYRDWSPPAQQRIAFEAQLELAARRGLPVIIHNREASADVLAVLASWVGALPDSLRARPGVLHSFSAPWRDAEKALALGFYIGFTGPVTYKKANELRQVAERVPLERLLVETDGPFLTPHPHRGERNEPAYVRFVAERISALHGISPDGLAQATTQNALALFWPGENLSDLTG